MREIKPINHNGSIQLKFSVSGKRYSLNPIPGGDFNKPKDISQAIAIATKISNDILTGYFDTSLERYRIVPKLSHQQTLSPLLCSTSGTLGLPLWRYPQQLRQTTTSV